jgi:hypothetical protein
VPPRILVLSFSPIARDARVMRHVDVLGARGEVTTCGFGPAPAGAADHVAVDDVASLPQTPRGVALLALHRHRAAKSAAPALRQAVQRLAGRRFDLVVANDARALPVAFAVADGAPVWADMHEWAPEERTQDWRWRLLVAPFADHLCRTYLPRAGAVSTVAPGIAELYRQRYGTDTRVVRNTRPFADLAPTQVPADRLRLVHSGAAVPGRFLEGTIAAVRALDERFSLDLYLVPGGDGGRYLRSLREAAGGDPRIAFRDPVPPAALPATLNAYDVGVFVMPPVHTNGRLTLPNKLFDYVQARLALVVSPSVEMERLVRGHGLGVVTRGYTAGDLADALRGLDREAVAGFKQASHEAARQLSSAEDAATVLDIADRLLDGSGTPGPSTSPGPG